MCDTNTPRPLILLKRKLDEIDKLLETVESVEVASELYVLREEYEEAIEKLEV